MGLSLRRVFNNMLVMVNFLQKKAFTFLVLLSSLSCCFAQDWEDQDYWIYRYKSVSYPLRSISISSSYGTRKDPFTGNRSLHGGLDLQASYEEALSMFEGVVENVGRDDRSGIYVKLRHGEYTISYCHLSRTCVEEGDSIEAGDVVGITGNTGRSTGPHLHLTVRLRGEMVDPFPLLLFVRDARKEAAAALGCNPKYRMTSEEFIRYWAPLAMEQQRRYGIPTSVTLAQMAYESGWGRSPLARNGNNYFGIKASRAWLAAGKPYSLHDDDKPQEAFCNYGSVEESIIHHSEVLMGDRYKGCRKYKETDYYNWLVQLKSAGYATAKNYVDICMKIIEGHKLYLYDATVANEGGT